MSLAKLLDIASPPVGPPIEDVRPAEQISPLVLPLLRERNGFVAFEAALHVFPAGANDEDHDVVEWNAPDLWRDAYGALADGHYFFAEDAFGGQFSVREDGIFTFDPETGDTQRIAGDFEEWATYVMDDFEFVTGYPLAHEWQERHGPLKPRHRLVPAVPFVLGGEYDVSNLEEREAVHAMRFRGDIAQQIADLPEGAPVKIRFT